MRLSIRVILISAICSLIINCKGPEKSENKGLRFSDELESIYSVQIKDYSIDINGIKTNQGAKLTLETMDQLFESPYTIPDVFGRFNKSVIRSISNSTYLVHMGYRLLGAVSGGFGPPVRGQNDRIPDIHDENELNQHVEDLKNRGVIYVNLNKVESWQQIELSTRVIIIRTLFILEQNQNLVCSYLSPIMKNESHLIYNTMDSLKRLYKKYFEPLNSRQMLDFSAINTLKEIDLTQISFVSRRITDQLNQVVSAFNVPVESKFGSCEFDTKFGKVAVFGHDNHKIEGKYCLSVDLGGDDIYSGNISSSIFKDMPISILLDFGGNDNYSEVSGYGKLASGIFGVSILWDHDGDDMYETSGAGIASAFLGCALLIDENGDDFYICNGDFSMASSYFGLALLLDKRGNDRYECGSYSLGFGGTKGVGLMIDVAGNDTFNSIINSKTSFILGAAKGRWAEATDGQNLGGGFGMFMDINGNDIYNSNSFSQGAAYYLSTGSFYDGGGDDQYNAVSHSQGYAAHFALANFKDLKGNDSYNSQSDLKQITQILGSGRDLSTGFFIDDEGNDSYCFGNRSVGIGDMNGFGLFIDRDGDDNYCWIKNQLNKASGSMGEQAELSSNQHLTSRIFENQTKTKGYFIDEVGNNELHVHMN
ncbi:MAG: hypothetical protein KQH67_09090 [Bacteroidetes bacterium]|nr:hypothetical protein [Bacteroidota bacterium]